MREPGKVDNTDQQQSAHTENTHVARGRARRGQGRAGLLLPAFDHMEDRLLPLKQTVRHPLDPRTRFHIRRPKEQCIPQRGTCPLPSHPALTTGRAIPTLWMLAGSVTVEGGVPGVVRPAEGQWM
jgi:hypothetical protein